MELHFPSRLLNCSTSEIRVSIPERALLIRSQSQIFTTNRNLIRSMNSQQLTCSCYAALPGHNGSPVTSSLSAESGRVGEVKRVTRETNVFVKINLDGSGVANSDSGISFLDHMLDQLSSHGLFDVHVKASGDAHIDDHHTNEDVALAIGTALLQALGDRKGINRFGDFTAPLDEALVQVTLDLSGRPHLSCNLDIPTERVGNYDTQLVEHFFQSLVNTSGMTLHIRQLAGKNSHHIIEATFKAFARALRQAIEYDPRRLGSVPRCMMDQRMPNASSLNNHHS
ncbi:Imidazoleglycerol-phosphate dehydratase [Dillenia turbinata]|uniref:Imidazoleglycerol-phosphate dehydratase n=1 Tax=Dillenia turbinata TaxID=194707 RepID=A0AAN8YV62_9MAGN